MHTPEVPTGLEDVRAADVTFQLGSREYRLKLPVNCKKPLPFHLNYGAFFVDMDDTKVEEKVLSLCLPHTRIGLFGCCKRIYPEVTQVEVQSENIWAIVEPKDHMDYLARASRYELDPWAKDETEFMEVHSVRSRESASPGLCEAIAAKTK